MSERTLRHARSGALSQNGSCTSAFEQALAMPTEIVRISSFSDGDATHRPASPWTAANPTIYFEKLATKWMESKQSARLGEYLPSFVETLLSN